MVGQLWGKKEAKCPVPFCVNIKNTLRQQRLQQAQILKRLIATMQNCDMSDAVLQPSPGNSNSSSQPSPGAQPHTSPHPPQGEGEDSMDGKKKGQKSSRNKKSNKSKNNLRKSNMKSNVPKAGNDSSAKICSTMEKHNEDFDSCANCFTNGGHQHKMEKLGFGLDDDSGTGDQKQTNPQKSPLIAIQRCIRYLVHACRCRDANCRLSTCQKMKKIVQHVKNCKQKTNYECSVCKQIIALCCYHAKHCQEAKCPVPYCVNVKNKLRQQQLQQRLQQAQILKRRIATMQNRGMSGAVLQPSPGNSNSSSQPSPGAQPHTSPHPPQPGIGMKPSSGPPVGALQAVQQVQAAAARQTVPHMVAANYGKES